MDKNLLTNKKGISGIVTAVIMIALVMVVGVIVWVVVRNVVQGQIGNVQSCLEVYDKVTLNSQYTCYDSTNDEFHFSVNIGDVEIEKVIVSISSEGSTNSYELSDTDQTSLDTYPTAGGEVLVPAKNSGRTYIFDTTTEPDMIKIAPVTDGQQCEVSDSLSNIDECI